MKNLEVDVELKHVQEGIWEIDFLSFLNLVRDMVSGYRLLPVATLKKSLSQTPS